jgi:hypothetical protein
LNLQIRSGRKIHCLWAAGALVFLCFAGLSSAQDTGAQAGEKALASQQTAAAKASRPKPSAQITRLLQSLEGTWSIKDELAPDKNSPDGKTGIGTIVWRPGPGGFSVIEEFRSQQGDEEVTGLGEFWWVDTANGYHTIWCDSTNPGGCIDFKNSARWEGSKLVLEEDYEINRKKFTFREEFTDFTATTFTQTLYGGPLGGPLKVDETIHATRTGPAEN